MIFDWIKKISVLKAVVSPPALHKSIIQVAIGELGKHEEPKGSNWGTDVQKYLASVGIDFPAAWCAAFVFWCAQEALGNKNMLIKTGGVLYQWNNISSRLKTQAPEPGDIFIMDFGKGLGHCGIIEKVSADMLTTIEGNTNNDGSREGWEVERKVRNVKSCIGFIRLS